MWALVRWMAVILLFAGFGAEPAYCAQQNPSIEQTTVPVKRGSDDRPKSRKPMEEIIVTGSYIRRDNFNFVSPMSVVDATQIEEATTPNTADILWGETYDIGTAVIASPFNNDGGLGGENQAAAGVGDIRGLGAEATLSLMDGKRLPFGDANFNYPQIAIKRVETLLDGASALYGTDAIAGVINYIPIKTYNGFKIRYERRDLFRMSAPDEDLAVLFGAVGDRISGLFALDFRHQSRIEQYNFPKYSSGCRPDIVPIDPPGSNCFDTAFYNSDSNSGFPGGALRPIRDANGDLLMNKKGNLLTAQLASPGCGSTFMVPTDANGNPVQAVNSSFGSVGRGSDNPNIEFADRWGIPSEDGQSCGMNYAYLLDYQGAIPGFLHGYTRFEFDVSDNLTVSADLMFGRRKFNTRSMTAPSVASDPINVVGDNPGSPYRAFSDVNGNGVYEPAQGDQVLYAQDNCNFSNCKSGDGLPDRGIDANNDGKPDDLNGDGIPDAVPAEEAQWGAPVILAGPVGQDSNGNGIQDRFDPSAGIAFNNDVTLNQWSGFSYGEVQSLPDYAHPWSLRNRVETNIRFGTDIKFRFPNSSWETDTSYIWGLREQNYAFAWNATTNADVNNVTTRVNCVRNDSGVTPIGIASDCTPFNPFITSQFPVVNYVPQNEITPAFIPDPSNPGAQIPNPAYNTPEMVAGLYQPNDDQYIDDLKLFNFVANGSPFRMPLPWETGIVGMAFGLEVQVDSEELRPNAINAQNTNVHGTGISQRQSQMKAVDGFAELDLPLLHSSELGYLEMQLAARSTDVKYSANIGDTSARPKFSKFVPKLGLLYQPRDWISLRATYSEGFTTPPQEDVLADARQATRTDYDPTCRVLEQLYGIFLDASSGCLYSYDKSGNPTTSARSVLTDILSADPHLGPETSHSTSAGATFRFLDGDLTVDLDYVDITFLGEIVNVNQKLEQGIEQERFNAALMSVCGETPSASCSGTFRTDWLTGGEETSRYVRTTPLGPIVAHYGGYANTTGRFVTAYDFKTTYRFGADRIPWIGGPWGQFELTLNGTYNEHYIFSATPDSTPFDGAGYRNDSRGRLPVPRVRLSGGVRYNYGRHTARLSFTWHGMVKDLDTTGAIRQENADGKIASQAVFDLYYQYRMQMFKAPTSVSLRISNVFDSEPKALVDSAGIDPYLMGTSPLGRMWTVRIEQEL